LHEMAGFRCIGWENTSAFDSARVAALHYIALGGSIPVHPAPKLRMVSERLHRLRDSALKALFAFRQIAHHVSGMNDDVSDVHPERRTEKSMSCSFFVYLNCFVIMADVPTSAARTLVNVKDVGMLLLSYVRRRFQIIELFLGRFLARKDEFATPCAERSTIAPQWSPLRQLLLCIPFPHSCLLSLVRCVGLPTAPISTVRSRA